MEEYDDGYWSVFRELERTTREELAGGVRHLYEARLKESGRSADREGHAAHHPGSAEAATAERTFASTAATTSARRAVEDDRAAVRRSRASTDPTCRSPTCR